MSVDILRTNCDQCRSMVQCCFTSTETVGLIRTESPGRPPRLSHIVKSLRSIFRSCPLCRQLESSSYPDWWLQAWPRSAVTGQGNMFVGDSPLFPPCTASSRSGSGHGFVVSTGLPLPFWGKLLFVRSLLLYVHRDRTDGKPLDVHLHFDTAQELCCPDTTVRVDWAYNT